MFQLQRVTCDPLFLPCRCGCGIDGTSASAPLWNGVITLLNDWRFNHGQPPVGFINPLLYSAASSTTFQVRS